MRRALTVTVLAATLLLGAACSDSRDDVRSGAGGSTPSATAPLGNTATPGEGPGTVTAPAGGNAKEVCAAVTKVSSESVTTFVTELAKMLEATAAGDAQAAQAAQQKAEATLDRWAAEMRTQAGKATDAHLRAVLTEIAAEVGQMEANLETVDEVKLENLQKRLEQLCAG